MGYWSPNSSKTPILSRPGYIPVYVPAILFAVNRLFTLHYEFVIVIRYG